jgi:hypothetical protein
MKHNLLYYLHEEFTFYLLWDVLFYLGLWLDPSQLWVLSVQLFEQEGFQQDL